MSYSTEQAGKKKALGSGDLYKSGKKISECTNGI
jgi:hypothetical protein